MRPPDGAISGKVAGAARRVCCSCRAQTFIELHLLPRAKRNRTMGSRDSKARASQRTLPDTVWT